MGSRWRGGAKGRGLVSLCTAAVLSGCACVFVSVLSVPISGCLSPEGIHTSRKTLFAKCYVFLVKVIFFYTFFLSSHNYINIFI